VEQAVRVLAPVLQPERPGAQEVVDADARDGPAGGLQRRDDGVGQRFRARGRVAVDEQPDGGTGCGAPAQDQLDDALGEERRADGFDPGAHRASSPVPAAPRPGAATAPPGAS
jgi:hypothetical protein